MKTFGLGRHVNTFGLGLPYASRQTAPVERNQGGSQFYDEGMSEREKIKRQQRLDHIRREDEEITEFIRTILTKGLI